MTTHDAIKPADLSAQACQSLIRMHKTERSGILCAKRMCEHEPRHSMTSSISEWLQPKLFGAPDIACACLRDGNNMCRCCGAQAPRPADTTHITGTPPHNAVRAILDSWPAREFQQSGVVHRGRNRTAQHAAPQTVRHNVEGTRPCHFTAHVRNAKNTAPPASTKPRTTLQEPASPAAHPPQMATNAALS